MKTIVIYSFMTKDLKLKGSELLIYALIYSFSQFGLMCYMKPETIACDLGLSRSQVFRAIASLLSKRLIDSNFKGYCTKNNDFKDENLKSQLDELIKIAKTPWLE